MIRPVCLLSALTLSSLSWGALLQYDPIGSINPGFFFFTIDGVARQRLLCEEFNPNVTTSMYNSTVVSMADLLADNAAAHLTTLRLAGVSASTTLLFYTYVAYLDAKAYQGTALASDVVLANRWMIDGLKNGKTSNFVHDGTAGGSGPLTNGAMNLLTEVQSQTSFNINSSFRIYTSPFDISGSRLTQEQGGYLADGSALPEPKSTLLFSLGLVGIFYYRRRQ